MRSISVNRFSYLTLFLGYMLLQKGLHLSHFFGIFAKGYIRFYDTQDDALEEIVRAYISIDNFCKYTMPILGKTVLGKCH